LTFSWLQPIYATVDAVADFAEQFTRLEAENSQLRKAVKSSADQVVEANRLAADAKSENTSLKEEVSRLKRQMKDDQDARRAAAAAVDEKEGVLRESIKGLLGKILVVLRLFLDAFSIDY
jgi:chromosome segregation ATPase